MCSGVLIGSFLDVLEVEAGFEVVQSWAAEQSSCQHWQYSRACNRGTTECYKERRLLAGYLNLVQLAPKVSGCGGEPGS